MFLSCITAVSKQHSKLFRLTAQIISAPNFIYVMYGLCTTRVVSHLIGDEADEVLYTVEEFDRINRDIILPESQSEPRNSELPEHFLNFLPGPLPLYYFSSRLPPAVSDLSLADMEPILSNREDVYDVKKELPLIHL